MEFKDKLKKLREEKGISKYQLAKEIGTSHQAITYWENGINEPKLSYIKQLAIFFDVTSDYLVGLEDELGNKITVINSFNNNNGIISISKK